jgi:hypothetical protein
MAPAPGPHLKLRNAAEGVAALFAIIIAIASLKFLKTYLERGLALATGLSFLLAVARIMALREREVSIRQRILDPSITAALVGSLAVLVSILAPIEHESSRASTPQASTIRFIQPPTKSVPRCGVYQGLGKIPSGRVLLIFDRGVDANGQSSGSKYYLDGRAAPNEAGWTTPKIDAGDTHVEVAAVLVPTGIADFMSSISPVGTDGKPFVGGAWVSNSLPLGEQISPSVLIDPDLNGTKPCK